MQTQRTLREGGQQKKKKQGQQKSVVSARTIPAAAPRLERQKPHIAQLHAWRLTVGFSLLLIRLLSQVCRQLES